MTQPKATQRIGIFASNSGKPELVGVCDAGVGFEEALSSFRAARSFTTWIGLEARLVPANTRMSSGSRRGKR